MNAADHSEIPLSLYVHMPWCVARCPYCDFNSHEIRTGEMPEQRYLDALVADLESALPLIWGRAVHSIFIGGGTPSLFSPQGIERLQIALRLTKAEARLLAVKRGARPSERQQLRARWEAARARLADDSSSVASCPPMIGKAIVSSANAIQPAAVYSTHQLACVNSRRDSLISGTKFMGDGYFTSINPELTYY